MGSSSSTATFTRTVIVGSNNSVSAPSPQTLGGTVYNFVSWSDGGAAAHNIVASTSTTYMATFQPGADTQPPTAPTNLIATAISSSQINLTWTAATDNVGVTQYRIERCEGHELHELRPSRDYGRRRTTATAGSLRGRATATASEPGDAADNLGPYSNIAGARTKN